MGGGTSLGKTTTSSVEETHAFGLTVGASVTVKGGIPFVAQAKTKLALEAGFHGGWGTSHEYKVSVGYSVGTGEDLVVFTAVAYDVLYYKILNAEYMEGQVEGDEEVEPGEILTVSLPNKEPRTYTMERALYNDKMKPRGLYQIPVDAKFGLDSKIGNPSSYPDKTQAALIKQTVNASRGNEKGFYAFDDSVNKFQSVGQSNTGFVTQNIAEAAGSSENWDWTASFTYTAIAEAGGLFASVELEASVKVDYVGSRSYTFSKETSVEGAVPNISTDVSKPLFNWGLLAFPVDDIKVNQDTKELEYYQTYTVVTYCVEMP